MHSANHHKEKGLSRLRLFLAPWVYPLSLGIVLLLGSCKDQPPVESESLPQPSSRLDSAGFSRLLAQAGDSIFRSPDKGYQMAREVEQLAQDMGSVHAVASSRNWQGIYFAMKSEYDTALNLFNEAYDIFDELDYQKGLSTVISNLALTYDYLGDINGAIALYERSLDLPGRGHDSLMLTNPLTNLGSIYASIGDYASAIGHYQQSLDIAERFGEKADEINPIFNLGTVYQIQEDYATALQYYERAKQLSDSTEYYPYQQAGILEGMGQVYTDLEQYDLAEAVFKEALEIAERNEIVETFSSSSNELAILYYRQGMLEIALGQALRNLEYTRGKGLKKPQMVALGTIAKVYRDQNLSNLAQQRAQESLELAQEIQEIIAQQDMHILLAEVTESLNNSKQTIFHERQARILQDSIFSRDRQEATRNAQVRLDTKLKEQENVALQQEIQLQDALLQNRKIQIWSITAVLGIFLLAALLLFLQNRKITKLNRDLEELNEDQRKLLLLLSHDFRTPLTYIYGWLNLHQLENGDHQTGRTPFIAYCLSTLKRMENYVGYIIALVRKEAFVIKPAFEEVWLEERLADWVEQLQPIAEQLGLKLQVAGRLPTTSVLTDPMLVHHIFDNLMSNALKYARKNTVVDYELERVSNEELLLIVSNEVTDNTTARLQEQEENPTDIMLNKSHGVGLSMVTTYVKSLDGEWGLEYIGNRIRAWVRLPIVKAES